MVSLLACGLSTATNSTPEFIKVAMKVQVGHRPSWIGCHAISICCLRQASSARASSGRIGALAALDLDELADQLPSVPVEIVHDRLLLGLKTQTALALA